MKPNDVLVDPEDERLLNEYSWWLERRPHTSYVQGRIDGKKVLLHRTIMEAPDGVEVDHRNGDGLDNRRENLRLCTTSQNHANSGPRGGRRLKGVTYDKARCKWRAQIGIDGNKRYLGLFDTEEDAARAYDAAALEAWGEFAYLNYSTIN